MYPRQVADANRGTFSDAQASGRDQCTEQGHLSSIVDTDLLQDSGPKRGIETCPLIRVEIRHLARDVIRHEKLAGVASNRIP